MSQRVPSWDLDINSFRSNSNSISPYVSTLGYEVAELTWENGQLAMHGFDQPRLPVKPPVFAGGTRAGRTLESIVDQATNVPKLNPTFTVGSISDDLVPCFDRHRTPVAGGMAMDALVPSSTPVAQQLDPFPKFGTSVVRSLTRVGSCSGAAAKRATKRRAVAARLVPTNSFSGSATFEKDSRHVTIDTCENDLAFGFTSTSIGSPENTSSDKGFSKTTTTTDDHDSVCFSKRRQVEAGNGQDKKKGNRKSSVSTKRSRAAAIHNQSERKRRDKINQRMKTLQKMVPNSSKTDKASMLDEVIEYLKQLQAQVTMMNRMNMSPMMLTLAMQQHLQMSMMMPMGMGMGMGMGIGIPGVTDMNTMGRHTMNAISPLLNPIAFTPSWDGTGGDPSMAVPMTDPLSAFSACQSQPMTMEAYSRMAALYQQLQQPQGSSYRKT